jgi:Arc-like DNA binding domain
MARKRAAPVQIKIRLPDALRRDLEREATKNGRTLNGEIVHRLTQPFVQADRLAVAEAAAERAVERYLKRATPAERAAYQAGVEAAEQDYRESLKEEPKK